MPILVGPILRVEKEVPLHKMTNTTAVGSMGQLNAIKASMEPLDHEEYGEQQHRVYHADTGMIKAIGGYLWVTCHRAK